MGERGNLSSQKTDFVNGTPMSSELVVRQHRQPNFSLWKIDEATRIGEEMMMRNDGQHFASGRSVPLHLHRSLLYPITIQYCKDGVRSDPTNGALTVGAAESRRAANREAGIIGS